MKKLIIAGAVLLFVFVAAPVFAKSPKFVKFVKFQSLDVPAASSTMDPAHVQSLSLKKCVKYKVTVTGTYDANDGITADAEYSMRTPTSNGVWTDSVSNYESYGETLLDLFMNDDNDWGAYNSKHKYSKTVVGNGNPLDFYIYDIYPINNSGSLHVDIKRTGRDKHCSPFSFATGSIKMSNPSQKMIFNAFDFSDDSDHDKGMVEYWNYDYSGGPLHYKAKVLCSDVNDDEARFMFQIPAGWPGLTGLYVVSYVKDGGSPGTKDSYGHNATSDLTTATAWCEDGTGFSPAMYTVTGGNLVVHD